MQGVYLLANTKCERRMCMMKKAIRIFALILGLLTVVSTVIACGSNPAGTGGDETEGNDSHVAVDEVGNGKRVMTFIMGHEQNTTTSNKWRGWNDSGETGAHQPDKTTEAGLRDIASPKVRQSTT